MDYFWVGVETVKYGAGVIFGVNDASGQEMREVDAKVQAVKPQHVPSQPRPLHGAPGREKTWHPKRVTFVVPDRPTGFARVTSYWKAHWAFVAERFIDPITAVVSWSSNVLYAPNLPEVKRPPPIRPTQFGEPAKLDADREAQYSQAFSNVLLKTCLPGQQQACDQIGLIIARSMLVAGEPIGLAGLLPGIEAAHDLEDRLTTLLTGLTRSLHVDDCTRPDWKKVGYSDLEKEGVRDLLTFRERTLCRISDYMTTMLPKACEFREKEGREGQLRKALEDEKLLPTKSIGSHLVERLPGLVERFETERERALLTWLSGFLAENDQLIDHGLDALCEDLFGRQAIDYYLAAAFGLVGEKSTREDSPVVEREQASHLTDTETSAICALASSVVGNLLPNRIAIAGTIEWRSVATVVRWGVDKGLGQLLVKKADSEGRPCSLDLTVLIPALKKAAEQALIRPDAKKEYYKALFAQAGIEAENFLKLQPSNFSGWRWRVIAPMRPFVAVRNLRKLLREYPLLLDNLLRLLIHDAIDYFL